MTNPTIGELAIRIKQEASQLALTRTRIEAKQNKLEEVEEKMQAILIKHGLIEKQTEIMSEIKELREQAKEEKEAIGETALIGWKAYQKKKVVPEAVTVRVYTKYDIPEDKAIAFAISREMPALLKINKKTYKKQIDIGTMPDIPGKALPDPRPFVSSDLSQFLAEKGVNGENIAD